MIQRHESNKLGRDFFVGDIHGQLELLNAEMRRVKFDKARDRLFSVGDLIDRGADSYMCLSLAFEPWFFGVRGNHEMLAHDALNGNSGHEHWMINGGVWALSENMREVRQILNEALRYLPYARELEASGKRIGMVHAEPPGDWTLVNVTGYRQEMIWGRSRISSRDDTLVSGIDAVVVGHTIVIEPTWLGNVFYIDTGAFQTGRLTLIDAREVLA